MKPSRKADISFKYVDPIVVRFILCPTKEEKNLNVILGQKGLDTKKKDENKISKIQHLINTFVPKFNSSNRMRKTSKYKYNLLQSCVQ